MSDSRDTNLSEACRRLALPAFETQILRDCSHAWSLVSNGHYLVSPRKRPAVDRLVERGYLAKAGKQPIAFGGDIGVVVVMEQEHINKLITDANATMLTSAESQQ